MHIRWRGLELPSQVTCETETLTGSYGKFLAEPFERGFGTTIGNGLRRILLSSLEGSAVTQIKVHNAQHEFTTIAGVLEDVTDIVLNIKSLVVKNHGESTKVLRVERNTAGLVTAADIETDESVEVINKDLVIATLTEDVPFVIEMVVENGRGYIPATEHGVNIQEVGIIPIDAVFSPVTRVRYDIVETRVGQKNQLRQAHHRNSDRWFGQSRDGLGRSVENFAQASHAVCPVHRAWPTGALRHAGRHHEQCR